MSNDTTPMPGDSAKLVIPAFRGSPALSLEISKTRDAEGRLIEAKTVNPITYVELEFSFQEAYRELKKNMAKIGHEISKTDKALREAKADVLLDEYPVFLEKIGKSKDNADLRDAVLIKSEKYSKALDHLNMLKATEVYFDGKIKVFENVSRYMKKQMDLLIRSGLASSNLHVTGDKKW